MFQSAVYIIQKIPSKLPKLTDNLKFLKIIMPNLTDENIHIFIIKDNNKPYSLLQFLCMKFQKNNLLYLIEKLKLTAANFMINHLKEHDSPLKYLFMNKDWKDVICNIKGITSQMIDSIKLMEYMLINPDELAHAGDVINWLKERNIIITKSQLLVARNSSDNRNILQVLCIRFQKNDLLYLIKKLKLAAADFMVNFSNKYYTSLRYLFKNKDWKEVVCKIKGITLKMLILTDKFGNLLMSICNKPYAVDIINWMKEKNIIITKSHVVNDSGLGYSILCLLCKIFRKKALLYLIKEFKLTAVDFMVNFSDKYYTSLRFLFKNEDWKDVICNINGITTKMIVSHTKTGSILQTISTKPYAVDIINWMIEKNFIIKKSHLVNNSGLGKTILYTLLQYKLFSETQNIFTRMNIIFSYNDIKDIKIVNTSMIIYLCKYATAYPIFNNIIEITRESLLEKDKDGYTCLHYLCDNKMEGSINYLCKCGVSFKEEHCNTEMEISYLKTIKML